MSKCVIKSVNLRGSWNLETINDECPICRNSVLETCVECSSTVNPQCISVMGECSHVYHLHCIEKWTKTKNICPLDNKKWEYKRPDHFCKIIKDNKMVNYDTSGNVIGQQPTDLSGNFMGLVSAGISTQEQQQPIPWISENTTNTMSTVFSESNMNIIESNINIINNISPNNYIYNNYIYNNNINNNYTDISGNSI